MVSIRDECRGKGEVKIEIWAKGEVRYCHRVSVRDRFRARER